MGGWAYKDGCLPKAALKAWHGSDKKGSSGTHNTGISGVHSPALQAQVTTNPVARGGSYGPEPADGSFMIIRIFGKKIAWKHFKGQAESLSLCLKGTDYRTEL